MRPSGPGGAPRTPPNSAAETLGHPRAEAPGGRPLFPAPPGGEAGRPVGGRRPAPLRPGRGVAAPPAPPLVAAARLAAPRSGLELRAGRCGSGPAPVPASAPRATGPRPHPRRLTRYLRARSACRAAVSHADTRNANLAAEPLRPRSDAVGRDVPKRRAGDAPCSRAVASSPDSRGGSPPRREAGADGAEAGEEGWGRRGAAGGGGAGLPRVLDAPGAGPAPRAEAPPGAGIAAAAPPSP